MFVNYSTCDVGTKYSCDASFTPLLSKDSQAIGNTSSLIVEVFMPQL
jgi:hypothetical protein